jgi:hypothetical protein
MSVIKTFLQAPISMTLWQKPSMVHVQHFLTLMQIKTWCLVYAPDTCIGPFCSLARGVPIGRIIIDGYEQHASQGKVFLQMRIIYLYSFSSKKFQIFQRCKVHINVVTRLFWAPELVVRAWYTSASCTTMEKCCKCQDSPARCCGWY